MVIKWPKELEKLGSKSAVTPLLPILSSLIDGKLANNLEISFFNIPTCWKFYRDTSSALREHRRDHDFRISI